MNAMNKTIPTFAEAVADIPIAPTAQADAEPKRDGVPALYCHPAAAGLRTPFRDAVCRLILRRASEIAAPEPVSAELSEWSHPEEEDTRTLVLTVFIDADWDGVKNARGDILNHMRRISRDWSASEKEDYRKRIHFEVFPSQP